MGGCCHTVCCFRTVQWVGIGHFHVLEGNVIDHGRLTSGAVQKVLCWGGRLERGGGGMALMWCSWEMVGPGPGGGGGRGDTFDLLGISVGETYQHILVG